MLARLWPAALIAFGLLAWTACASDSDIEPQETRRAGQTEELGPPLSLAEVRYWAYQIQGLDREGAVEALVDSHYDLVVIEPTRTIVGSEDFDSQDVVERIKGSANSLGTGTKLVLAYVDIGEAEAYRTYWQDDWQAPELGQRGNPDFLVTLDPDGWSGNFPVAYWDQRWKEIVIYGKGSLLDLVLEDGFDGIYLDWVGAFDDLSVMEAARGAGVDPAEEMIAFIREIREYAAERRPGFLIIAQNGADLLDDHPQYLDIIDGIAQEDLSFQGEADTDWEDEESGDIRQERDYSQYLADVLRRYVERGVPTFCIQYARVPENIEKALRDAEEVGCVPYMTLTPLDRLTETPPPGY